MATSSKAETNYWGWRLFFSLFIFGIVLDVEFPIFSLSSDDFHLSPLTLRTFRNGVLVSDYQALSIPIKLLDLTTVIGAILLIMRRKSLLFWDSINSKTFITLFLFSISCLLSILLNLTNYNTGQLVVAGLYSIKILQCVILGLASWLLVSKKPPEDLLNVTVTALTFAMFFLFGFRYLSPSLIGDRMETYGVLFLILTFACVLRERIYIDSDKHGLRPAKRVDLIIIGLTMLAVFIAVTSLKRGIEAAWILTILAALLMQLFLRLKSTGPLAIATLWFFAVFCYQAAGLVNEKNMYYSQLVTQALEERPGFEQLAAYSQIPPQEIELSDGLFASEENSSSTRADSTYEGHSLVVRKEITPKKSQGLFGSGPRLNAVHYEFIDALESLYPGAGKAYEAFGSRLDYSLGERLAKTILSVRIFLDEPSFFGHGYGSTRYKFDFLPDSALQLFLEVGIVLFFIPILALLISRNIVGTKYRKTKEAWFFTLLIFGFCLLMALTCNPLYMNRFVAALSFSVLTISLLKNPS